MLPTAAKSYWMLQLTLPGSCLELSAPSRARHLLWWGAAGQAKDKAVPWIRLYLHRDLTTLLWVAIVIPLSLNQRVYSSPHLLQVGRHPWVLADLQRLV